MKKFISFLASGTVSLSLLVGPTFVMAQQQMSGPGGPGGSGGFEEHDENPVNMIPSNLRKLFEGALKSISVEGCEGITKLVPFGECIMEDGDEEEALNELSSYFNSQLGRMRNKRSSKARQLQQAVSFITTALKGIEMRNVMEDEGQKMQEDALQMMEAEKAAGLKRMQEERERMKENMQQRIQGGMPGQGPRQSGENDGSGQGNNQGPQGWGAPSWSNSNSPNQFSREGQRPGMPGGMSGQGGSQGMYGMPGKSGMGGMYGMPGQGMGQGMNQGMGQNMGQVMPWMSGGQFDPSKMPNPDEIRRQMEQGITNSTMQGMGMPPGGMPGMAPGMGGPQQQMQQPMMNQPPMEPMTAPTQPSAYTDDRYGALANILWLISEILNQR